MPFHAHGVWNGYFNRYTMFIHNFDISVVAGGRERRRVYGLQGFEAVRDRRGHRPREVAFRRRRKLGGELARRGARKGDLRHVGFQPLCRAGCRDRQGARPAARQGLCVFVREFSIGSIFSSPLIVDGVVFFGGTDGYLYALG
jgi:hypothetical protein